LLVGDGCRRELKLYYPNESSVSFQKVRTFLIARATPQRVQFVSDEVSRIDVKDARYVS
jgi:hypothetical protein